MKKAHQARSGATTGKGLCPGEVMGMPVDMYSVPCPEKTYEVFVNMYMCGPGAELWR
jgi:hypothetical protein